MNTANQNPGPGIGAGERCTVSYNTANDNSGFGIIAFGSRSLVTHNTAVNNGSAQPGFFVDFDVACPSDVTFNDSTHGFPDSYTLEGNGCKTNGNQ